MSATYQSTSSFQITGSTPGGTHTVGAAQVYMLAYLYTTRNMPTVSITYAGVPMTQLAALYNSSEGRTHFLFGLANPRAGANMLAGSLSAFNGGYLHAFDVRLAYDLDTNYGHMTYAGTTGNVISIAIPTEPEALAWCFGDVISQFTWTGGTVIVNDGTMGAAYKIYAGSATESPRQGGNSKALLGITVKGAAGLGQPVSVAPLFVR